MQSTRLALLTAGGQGVFYLLTGIWPLVHMTSFLAVTGPKTDLWLVRTVGILIAVSGGVLLAASLRRRVTPEIVFLGGGDALALAAIDIFYVSVKRIPPVYLLDAVAEIALAIVWIAAAWVGSRDQ